MESLKLNNGVVIPAVGLGTYPLNKLRLLWVFFQATRLGYRYFDTSAAYGNEKWLGRAIKLSGINRQGLFISSKISNRQQRSGQVRAALMTSLSNLGLSYLDMYLLHWPYPGKYLDSWKMLEEFYYEGLVRSIGVCNCHQHHLESIMNNCSVMPVINQIELHPLMNQKTLVEFCRQHGILVEAYTPLARMHQKLVDSKIIRDIAEIKKKAISQVVLRWDFQNGIVSIPKTSTIKRLKENIDIFDFSLDDEEMRLIDGLNCNFRLRFDPDNCNYDIL